MMSLESSIIDDCDVPQVATATTVLVLILIQVLTCQVISTSKLELAACCMAHIDKAGFSEYVVLMVCTIMIENQPMLFL